MADDSKKAARLEKALALVDILDREYATPEEADKAVADAVTGLVLRKNPYLLPAQPDVSKAIVTALRTVRGGGVIGGFFSRLFGRS